MSHYAKIVEPLDGDVHLHLREAFTLPVGTEIRSVKLRDGVYTCQALARLKYERQPRWVIFSTDLDLPAFTDKGREGRAKRTTRTAELQRGRPVRSNEPATVTVTIRVTPAQKRELLAGCAKSGTTITEVVTGTLAAAKLITVSP